MRKTVPAADPDAYVRALDGWRRTCVEMLRGAVRKAAKLEETMKWGHLVYAANGLALLIRAEDERVLLASMRRRLRGIGPASSPAASTMATFDIREGVTIDLRLSAPDPAGRRASTRSAIRPRPQGLGRRSAVPARGPA
jgi:hypothetical protein